MKSQHRNRRIKAEPGSRRPGRGAAAGILASTAAAVATSAVRRGIDAIWQQSSRQQRRWLRSNFKGDQVSLAEGPGIVAGLVTGGLVKLVCGEQPRNDTAHLIAVTSAGTLGLVDDLAEPDPARARGLRGHLSSLRQGRVTTGAVKLLGIGASSLAAAIIIATERREAGCTRTAVMVDVISDTALIAGMANLVNLLDLRPGRALKAATVLSMAVLPHSSHVVASMTAAAPGDLTGTHMAGDAGANALGAAVGSLWAAHLPRSLRIAAAAGVVGLNLASERVSFSRVIREVEILNTIDQWGVVQSAPETTEAG
ncbi:hypothetical protein SAMN06309944_2442 [Micrococcales bacterium KH10]|nr:hypothetical protein SAMN06309944_2442 [Micrococcales bacterium KH10]